MKHLYWILALAIMFSVGCNEGEQPLDPVEEPEVEIQTRILEVVSDKFMFMAQFSDEDLLILPSENTQMVTQVGHPTEVYVVIDGQLTKQEITFQEEIYHLLWCHLNGKIVLVNVLDNQIPYVSDEEDEAWIDENWIDKKTGQFTKEATQLWEEIAAEVKEEWEERVKGKDELTPEEANWEWEADTLWHKAVSKKPFFTYGESGDKIEVVIKHRFIYKDQTNLTETKEMEMIFVDVLRNLTRPHIVFPSSKQM
ncbi:MAG: hypothetical protein OXM61_22615 [Candidatus Poribacteria bacterium]|nr:hypothetical protein [Candidatus Poribacteria bacterium]